MNIDRYVMPETLSEALDILKNEAGACVLGGCGYLRMGRKQITAAIDLTKLNLTGISENENAIEIGAMTPLREIETSELLFCTFGPALRECTENIVGVQLRNVVTIGGTIAGKYPFSDVIPVLLALGAVVHFAENEPQTLEDFMEAKSVKDIITKISIPKNGQRAAYASIRNSATDYPMLNAAVSLADGAYRVFVGARPQKAIHSKMAEGALNSGKTPAEAGALAAEELSFGDNTRASAPYRKAVCKALVKRAAEEVQSAG